MNNLDAAAAIAALWLLIVLAYSLGQTHAYEQGVVDGWKSGRQAITDSEVELCWGPEREGI